MVPERSKRPEDDDNDRLATIEELIRATCGPVIDSVKTQLDLPITPQRIIAFAEQHRCKDKVIPLASLICGLFIETLEAETNDSRHIFATHEIRQRVSHIIKVHPVKVSSLIKRNSILDPHYHVEPELLKLAQKFLETI
jgi:hypothetical protein